MENGGISMLPHYLALLRVSVEKDHGTYLMVTNNVQSSALHMHRLYDLKGSEREASDKEKVSSSCWSRARNLVLMMLMCLL